MAKSSGGTRSFSYPIAQFKTKSGGTKATMFNNTNKGRTASQNFKASIDKRVAAARKERNNAYRRLRRKLAKNPGLDVSKERAAIKQAYNAKAGDLMRQSIKMSRTAKKKK